jgi:sugar/nucleoside kinase (ribokinase family)
VVPSTNVVCLGILVADVIARPVERLPPPGTVALLEDISLYGGGCALNTATVLTHFGVSVTVAGKVGADAFGEFLFGLLDERGIDRRGVQRDPKAPTSATVALVDAAAERTFLHLPGANGTLRGDELDLQLLASGEILHVAGALLMPSLDGLPMVELLAGVRARGVSTSLDTAFDATGGWARAEEYLPHLDLFAAGWEEARAISGEREPSRAAAWLRERGAGVVAVKLGASGCHVLGDSFEGHVPPVPVRAIDGTGAGDAFVAGLIYGRLAKWPLERAARFANAAGALATTAIGASEGLWGVEETLTAAGLV